MNELPNLYLWIKYLHVGCVSLSGLGFLIRGLLVLNNSNVMNHRWARILPHINDTILLTAAISLAAMSGQYPMTHHWLTAKVIGLLIYIFLGYLALRPSATQNRIHRLATFAAALLVFIWIVLVALNKNPMGL